MSNYRYMRSIVMFDLPTLTAIDKRNYRQFVKELKSSGFIMFQESIYVKLSINISSVDSMTKHLRKTLPPKGQIAILTVTEKQFNSIEYLLGEFTSDTIDSDKRVIEL